MVISHTYKYLFVEIPLTASWAIRNELCTHYDGAPILHKHATYPEFKQIAKGDEAEYFVFGTVRNPLDEVVSRYLKLKTDHKGVFSDAQSIQSLESDYSDWKKYQFIRNSDADFAAFFQKYHTRPFGNLIDVASDRYDFVIRYENLQEDFSAALQRLGIEQVRPVPMTNRTQGKKDWRTYYPAAVREQAFRVFGPFMDKWSYQFPPDWQVSQTHWFGKVEFHFANMLRNVYYTHLRYNDRVYARYARQLRAHLID